MANGNLPFPFPDAVSQFSVESTALGAQEGEHTGGYVNVVTRSGTNAWHGSAFEFLRNNFIDATNFYSTSKDTLHQNQYGGTFGGRIIRDKLFAFAGYQHLHADSSQALTQATVPTAANLAGDFSVTDGPDLRILEEIRPVRGSAHRRDLPATSTVPAAFLKQSLALQGYLPRSTPLTIQTAAVM